MPQPDQFGSRKLSALHRTSLLVVLGVFIGVMILTTTFVVSPEFDRANAQPAATIAAQNRITLTAIEGNLNATRTIIAGSRTAPAGTVRATATALSADARATLTAFVGSARMTGTFVGNSVKLTATSFATKIDASYATVAAKARATLGALATVRTATALPDRTTAVITTYAATILGTSVTVKEPRNPSYSIIGEIEQATLQNTFWAIEPLAIASYGATLNNGLALLHYGSGRISGLYEIDIQNDSVGAFVLAVDSRENLTQASALKLATTIYPGVAGLAFQNRLVPNGFSYYSVDTVAAIDPRTRQVAATGQSVVLYVVRASQTKVAVLAVVGRGQFAPFVR